MILIFKVPFQACNGSPTSTRKNSQEPVPSYIFRRGLLQTPTVDSTFENVCLRLPKKHTRAALVP